MGRGEGVRTYFRVIFPGMRLLHIWIDLSEIGTHPPAWTQTNARQKSFSVVESHEKTLKICWVKPNDVHHQKIMSKTLSQTRSIDFQSIYVRYDRFSNDYGQKLDMSFSSLKVKISSFVLVSMMVSFSKSGGPRKVNFDQVPKTEITPDLNRSPKSNFWLCRNLFQGPFRGFPARNFA